MHAEYETNESLPAAAASPQPCEEIPVPRVRKMVHEGVMTERERRAKIAEAHMPECDGNGCDFIAAKIRSGE